VLQLGGPAPERTMPVGPIIDHENFLTTPAGFNILQALCVDSLLILNLFDLSKYHANRYPDEIPFCEEEVKFHKFHDC